MKSPSQRACMAGAKLDDVTVSRPERLPTSPIQAECSVGVKRDTSSLWHRVERGIDRLAQSGDRMRPRNMGMVRRFLVLSSLVLLCCFIVMAGGVSKMFVRLLRKASCEPYLLASWPISHQRSRSEAKAGSLRHCD